MSKKIIIIGAGIAGLTAGIFAQQNGFESIIYEKHFLSGGECTGWNREGFHIDGCIHWLLGTKKGTEIYDLWKNIGGLGENIKVYNSDIIVQVEYQNQEIILYRNIEKFKKELLSISPEDNEKIDEMCFYIKRFFGFEPPIEKPFDMMNLKELIKMGIKMKDIGKLMKKLNKISIKEYVEGFKNSGIKLALTSFVHDYYSASILFFSLAALMSGNGGFPEKGSLEFSKRIEKRYLELGGKIQFSSEGEEILIEKNTAKGIRLKNGDNVYADYIIPSCDINFLFKNLLNGKYIDKKIHNMFNNPEIYPINSCVYISYGIEKDLSNFPKNMVFEIEKTSFENKIIDSISLKNYSYEPNFAPLGSTVVIVYLSANYDWWKEKSKNYEEYNLEKKRISESTKKSIEKKFPELKNKIKVLDVATPLTYERFCNAYKGSWMSFGKTPRGKEFYHNGKIKGINNLFLAGQWLISSGGLPAAAMSGKWAIQRIINNRQRGL